MRGHVLKAFFCFLKQCYYCQDPIHLRSTCKPVQPRVVGKHVICHACLKILCKRCNKPLVSEHRNHCTCTSISRTLPDHVIEKTLQPLLQPSRISILLQMCKSVSHSDIFSPQKQCWFVLPDYSTITPELLRICLSGEVTALRHLKLARSDDLVYASVNESLNQASFDVLNFLVCDQFLNCHKHTRITAI